MNRKINRYLLNKEYKIKKTRRRKNYRLKKVINRNRHQKMKKKFKIKFHNRGKK